MSSWELTLRGYLTNEATVGEQGLVNIHVRRVRRSHFRDLGVRDSPSSPELKRRLTLPLSGLDSTCSHDAIEGALDFMSVSTDFQTPITERILSFASDLAVTGSNRTEFYVNASLKIITSDELALVTDEPPPPPRDRSVMKLKKRRRLDDGADDRDDPESCSICIDDLFGDDDSKLTELPCNHVFHDRCITRWLLTKNSCPLCRYKFDDH